MANLIRENNDMKGEAMKPNNIICNNRLFCSKCNNMIEFMYPMIEKLQLDVCNQYGFTLQSSMVLFSGVCRDCLLKNALIPKS
jgi:Fe2+ or Zn2+ uptake regulation protein